MTTQEAYKFGFLLQCALEGCSPSEIERRITKVAGLGDLPGQVVAGGLGAARGVADAVKSMIPVAQKGLFWGTIGAPVLGGLGAGYGIAQLTDSPVSPEDAKQEELIEEYRRALSQLQRPPR